MREGRDEAQYDLGVPLNRLVTDSGSHKAWKAGMNGERLSEAIEDIHQLQKRDPDSYRALREMHRQGETRADSEDL